MIQKEDVFILKVLRIINLWFNEDSIKVESCHEISLEYS